MSPAACWGVIPAGGSGSRFSESQDKLLAHLGGQPVLCRSVAALLQIPALAGVVITASQQNLPVYQALLTATFPAAPLIFTTGGTTRRESVYQGLLALPPQVEIVVIHDAARPLIETVTIEKALQTVVQGALGSVVATPVVDTLKQVSPEQQPLQIQQTVDRSCLWRAQTPQVFRLKALKEAHETTPAHLTVTDDAQLLEHLGLGPIHIIPGRASNLKITTPEDLLLAEWYLQAQTQNAL